MIVPVPVDRAAAMAVPMNIPREHDRLIAQRRIERVMRRRYIMAVVRMVVAVLAPTLVMLGELGLVTVRMALVIDDYRKSELVRLGNFLDRFPIGWAGQPEARGHA